MNWIGEAGDAYLRSVWQAAIDPQRFRTFRREEAYREILEHVSDGLGSAYWSLIDNPAVRQLCLASEFADTVGRPVVHSYECRLLSPTTMRYGKVLNDLLKYFPDFSRMQAIAEIGTGYGGQARMISEFGRHTHSALRSYTLIDLYPVLLLCREYLEHFTLYPSCQYRTRSEIVAEQSWDLAISNYAFSEFSRELQEEYIRLVLEKSKSGYLTMNTGSLGAGRHLTAEQLSKMLPNAVVLEEEPKTKDGNYVLLFGEHI